MKAIDNDTTANNQKIFLRFITKLSKEKRIKTNDKETNLTFKK